MSGRGRRLKALALLTAGVLLILAAGCGKREKPMPRVEVTTPTAARSGDVVISYVLYDIESRPADISVRYSLDGGANYSDATEGPDGDGTVGLASSQRGVGHSFVWDSFADAGYVNEDNVRIEITATTRRWGFPSSSAYFTLENFQFGLWEPNARVDDGGAAAAASPALAAYGADVYAAWTDHRNGHADIFFAYSANEGTTWEASILVNDDITVANQEQPAIACDGAGTVYVAWADYRDTDANIYLSSWNGGTTFSANTMVNSATALGNATEPVIAVEGSTLYVAWTDTRSGEGDIYFRRSTDGGLSWDDEIPVDVDAADQYEPAIATDGAGTVFLAWTDTRNADADIYLTSWSGGTTFSTSLMVNDPAAGAATQPAIAVDSGAGGTSVYVAYTDTRNTDLDIFVATSIDSGATFATSVKASDDPGEGAQEAAAIAVGSGGEVLVVFADKRSDGPSIYLTSSTTPAVSFAPCVRIDDDYSNAAQVEPDIARGLRVFVAFTDARNGDNDIYFTRKPKD